jgi:hypothetical protein
MNNGLFFSLSFPSWELEGKRGVGKNNIIIKV